MNVSAIISSYHYKFFFVILLALTLPTASLTATTFHGAGEKLASTPGYDLYLSKDSSTCRAARPVNASWHGPWVVMVWKDHNGILLLDEHYDQIILKQILPIVISTCTPPIDTLVVLNYLEGVRLFGDEFRGSGILSYQDEAAYPAKFEGSWEADKQDMPLSMRSVDFSGEVPKMRAMQPGERYTKSVRDFVALYDEAAKATAARIALREEQRKLRLKLEGLEHKRQTLIDELDTQEWLKSAEQGNAQAQFQVGLRYFQGSRGLSKDLVQAYKFFALAATQGYAGEGTTAANARDIVASELSFSELQRAKELVSAFLPVAKTPK